MKTTTCLCLSLVLGLFAANASAVTNECHVAEGATKSVSDFGYTWQKGDWLLKTGPGELKAVNNKDVAYNLLIKEGVYFVANSIYQKGGATLIVRKGAAVRCDGTTQDAFSGDWHVYLAGDGTGTGDNLGAFCLGGGLTDPTFGTSSTFFLSDDATIYSFGTMNAVISGSAATSGPSLQMKGHTLTIRGKKSTSVFRPRWKWTLTKTVGPMIVRGGQFARHDTTNDFGENIPLVSVKDNGKLAAYGDGKIWSKVDAFDFERGSSMAKGNGSPEVSTLTMKKLSGPATVNDTVLTVSNELGVRAADLLDGHSLTVAKSLTFASGCKLSVSDVYRLSLLPGASYVVAQADGGITGLPSLTGEAADFFTLEVSDGQLVMTAKATNKVAALREGAEHAADNTAAMAALTLADNDKIVFPGGDYSFSAPIDFTGATASNVTLLCLSGTSTTLRVGLQLGAMKAVSLRNLTFRDFSTPAVIATGTLGLTIENCTLAAVKGNYGEAGNYPYALINVTDFTLTNPTYVPDAAGAESTLWDAQAYFEGGTQTANSEAREGMLVICARSGLVKDDWWAFHDMTNSFHLTTNGYSGKILCKTGFATLDGTTAVNIGNLGIAGIEVQTGQYVARGNSSLGVKYAPVHVCSGAALTLFRASDRTISFSGTGVNSSTPAIRFTGDNAWDKTSEMCWQMEDDATMYNNCDGENGTFLRSTIKTGGHTLTLRGVKKANYRFGRRCSWYGGGTFIVDAVILSASSREADGATFQIKDDSKPVFKFINKAQFIPDTADILNLVKNVDFAAGTTIGWKSGNAAFALAFDSLTGAPVVSNNYTRLTVKQTYTARMADVKAGKVLTLGVGTPMTFADGATVTLQDDALAAPTQSYTMISAPSGFTGKRPKLDAAAKAAGWGLAYNAERTELLVGPKQGIVVIIR